MTLVIINPRAAAAAGAPSPAWEIHSQPRL